MARIKLEIDTEAFYSDEEKQDLLEAFIEWAVANDPDADPESAEVEITKEKVAAGVTEDTKRAIIETFLEKASIVTTISLDGEELVQIGE